jgi:hypothetical protein
MKQTAISRQKAEEKQFREQFSTIEELEQMTDKPKPWPYNAAYARDQSAYAAQEILKLLATGLEMTSNPDLLRIFYLVQKYGNVILRHMESQGAPTRPEKF